jgi:hypothetical protein
MTDRAIVPGSGIRLRRYYGTLLLLVTAGMPVLLAVAVTLAYPTGDAALTAVAGLVAAVTAGVLVVVAVVRARSSVAPDAISPQGLRTAGTLAMTAQVIGLGGAVITFALGLVERSLGAERAIEIGGLLALCCIFPGGVAGTVYRLSRRLTG